MCLQGSVQRRLWKYLLSIMKNWSSTPADWEQKEWDDFFKVYWKQKSVDSFSSSFSSISHFDNLSSNLPHSPALCSVNHDLKTLIEPFIWNRFHLEMMGTNQREEERGRVQTWGWSLSVLSAGRAALSVDQTNLWSTAQPRPDTREQRSFIHTLIFRGHSESVTGSGYQHIRELRQEVKSVHTGPINRFLFSSLLCRLQVDQRALRAVCQVCREK